MWDTQTLRLKGEVRRAHNGVVTQALFTPSGLILLTVGTDNHLRVRDVVPSNIRSFSFCVCAFSYCFYVLAFFLGLDQMWKTETSPYTLQREHLVYNPPCVGLSFIQ